MSKIYFNLFLSLIVSNILFGQVDTTALPFTDSVITCFPDTTGYKRISVGPIGRDFSNLQSALNQAVSGTVIVLDAGVEFRGSFLLPSKPVSDKWIVLVSSKMDLVPAEGSRIKPYQKTGDQNFSTQADAMPKVVTDNLSGVPCFRTEIGTHHYRLVGIEIKADERVINSYGLVNLGDGSSLQNQFSKVPHHLIVDRCFIHGHTKGEIMKYGIRLDCAYSAVVDCHISDFHSVGFDAQSISSINGPGPFKIINNYLEASGENILFGGGAAAIAGLVPSDIEIRQNHFFKPHSWRVGHPSYARKHWTVKNLFELKTGKRVLLEGNILENCWADLPIGQSGYAILLTIRTENGGSPQAEVSDITIRNNIIKNTGAGISISGLDDGKGIRSKRIYISNNLFEDINGVVNGDQNLSGPNVGTAFHIGEPENVTIDHNTIFHTGAITWAYKKMTGFVYTNNISNCFISGGGYQGIYGPGYSQGNGTIGNYFPDITDANQRFHKNVMIKGDPGKYTNFAMLSKNYFPNNSDAVGFYDFANGGVDYLNYRLKNSSTYFKNGSDGKDIGADMNLIKAAFERNRDCSSVMTAVNEMDFNYEFLIYPNPAKDKLKIETFGKEFFSYNIYNQQGHIFKSGNITEPSQEINISGIKPGIYYIKLFNTRLMGLNKLVILP
ncbi:MAG: T9SS type A sorting domain-containing protein [Saprospiraceae bacterium]